MDSLDKEYHDSDDLYCYYSDLPSPMAYHQNNIVNDCDILPKKEEIMNNLDKQYIELLQDIIDNGIRKEDRTGTGTISIFGKQIRHKMYEGFPLITTKKMFWKGIVTELIWFLRGDTNIKFLVDNDCHIWDGDAYQSYCKRYWQLDERDKIEYGSSYYNHETNEYEFETYSKEEFVNYIKTNDAFAKKWGELGPVYGKQWRNWGGWKDTKQIGFLHKTDNGWSVKWSDLHSFGNGTEWLITPIQDSDQSLYSDEDEGKKVYYKNITLGYDEKSFYPIQVAKVIDVNLDNYVGGIDQIANLINDIKTNPDSRRLLVSAWNVGELDSMTLPPCHYGFQVYTRELSLEERLCIADKFNPLIREDCLTKTHHPDETEELKSQYRHEWLDSLGPNVVPQRRAISLMWNQRSVDTFLGLPFNIASYGLLLEIIAKAVNMVPDELIGNLGDTHLYSNHIEQAKEQIGREPMELPKLNINTEFWLTEGGECGEGPLDAVAIFEGFKNDNFCRCLLEEDIQLCDYKSHATIKAQLSN